jgi:hypothetical protein
MALVKCYDPEGNEHMKESVDVRECVEHCGYTLNAPAVTTQADATPAPPAPVKASKSVPQVVTPVEPAVPTAPWQPQA